MKKFRLIGLLAAVLALAFVFAACGSATGSSGDAKGELVITGKNAKNQQVKTVFTSNKALEERYVITYLITGDEYVMYVDGVEASRGTVVVTNGIYLTFKPNNGPEFTGTLSGNNLSNLQGAGVPEGLAGYKTTTPSSGGGPSGPAVVNTDITAVSVTMSPTAPAKNATVPATATPGAATYTVEDVRWFENDAADGSGAFSAYSDPTFDAPKVYKVEIDLEPVEGKAFALSLTTKTICGNAADVVGSITASAVTLSYVFPATVDEDIVSITITAPSTATFEHGDPLLPADYTGLAYTVTYVPARTQNGTAAAPVAGVMIVLDKDGDDVEDPAFALYSYNGHGITLRANGVDNAGDPATIDSTGTGGTMDVDQKQLTVTSFTHTKVYDGTATITSPTVVFDGIYNTEDVTAGAITGGYASANKDALLAVTDIALSGTAAGNYKKPTTAHLATLTNAGAGITAKALAVTSATATKTYDGLNTATGATLVLGGAESADSSPAELATTYTVNGTYSSADVETSTLSLTLAALTGTSAGNYTIPTLTGLTNAGTGITKLAVEVTPNTGQSFTIDFTGSAASFDPDVNVISYVADPVISSPKTALSGKLDVANGAAANAAVAVTLGTLTTANNQNYTITLGGSVTVELVDG